jgi:hypothetical protein
VALVASAGLWSTQAYAGSDKIAAIVARVSPAVVRVVTVRPPARDQTMCGRPLGCKRKNENSDGRVDCDHVSGLY